MRRLRIITWGTIVPSLAIVALALGLSGCAGLAYDAVKLVYGDAPIVEDAKTAVGATLTLYDHTVQPSIEEYINWPTCGTAKAKGKILCKNLALARKMQAADDPTSEAIHKAVEVLSGVAADDSGTALTDAVNAVNAQNTDIIKAGVPR